MARILSTKLPLPNMYNFRDLGGIENIHGQHVKKHLLIRSDMLMRAEQETLNYCAALPLKLDVDFRAPYELVLRPDPDIPGCKKLNLPLSDPALRGVEKGYPHEPFDFKHPNLNALWFFIHLYSPTGDAYETMGINYRKMVSDPFPLKQWSTFFHEILAIKDGAVLYHCTDGKDRTGLATMLLLTLLEVPMETIREDYMLSLENNQPKIKALSDHMDTLDLPDPTMRERLLVTQYVDLRWLDGAVSAIKELGGFDYYFHECWGLTDSDIAEIRDRYLV